MKHLCAIVSALTAALASQAGAQCTPEWLPGPSGQFASYGTDLPCNALTTWYPPGSGSPRLVVGGQFGAVAGLPFNKLASWDGTAWTGMGSGAAPATGVINAATGFNGNLIVPGVFPSRGGPAPPNLA